jgi:hypothetical protein
MQRPAEKAWFLFGSLGWMDIIHGYIVDSQGAEEK